MKRTLIATTFALLGASVATAAAPSAKNLLYYYDFNTLVSQSDASSAPNLAGSLGGTNGSGSLSKSAWANFTESGDAYEGAHAYRTQTNSTDGMKLNFGAGEFSGGFTMSIMVRDFASWDKGASTSSAAIYGRILGLTDGTRTFFMQKTGDENNQSASLGVAAPWESFCVTGDLGASTKGANLGAWASDTISRDSFTNITLTFATSTSNADLTTVSVYFDGKRCLTADTTFDLDTLTSLQFAKTGIASTFDSLQVYNTAMNAGDVALLAANPTRVIPEPASATLSLLALGSLALRRRRK